MKNGFAPNPWGSDRRTGTLLHWFARHRRIITAHVLHGVCYGLGTGAVGFGFWWIEHHL